MYNRVANGKKLCGKCRRRKPETAFHRHGKYRVSWCKKCRKEYAAAYRQRPEVKQHNREYAREYKKDPRHQELRRAALRRYRSKPKTKIKKNTQRRMWCRQEKQKAVDYKGGKCQVCGYSRCLAALDFHHRDPSKKEGYMAGALAAHRSFERNKKEIDKCVLVCVRCHREIHAGVTPCPEC